MAASIPLQLLEPMVRRFEPHTALPLKAGTLWRIETGLVRALTWLEDGTAITLGLWGPGEFVGRALSRIEPFQLEGLTKVEATGVAIESLSNLSDILLEHLHQSEDLMLIRSYKRVDLMLLQLLNWLARRFGQQVQAGHLIDLRLTHQDLAELVGATRVTVTRTLNQLEQQGLIQRLPLQRIILQETQLWHYEI